MYVNKICFYLLLFIFLSTGLFGKGDNVSEGDFDNNLSFYAGFGMAYDNNNMIHIWSFDGRVLYKNGIFVFAGISAYSDYFFSARMQYELGSFRDLGIGYNIPLNEIFNINLAGGWSGNQMVKHGVSNPGFRVTQLFYRDSPNVYFEDMFIVSSEFSAGIKSARTGVDRRDLRIGLKISIRMNHIDSFYCLGLTFGYNG